MQRMIVRLKLRTASQLKPTSIMASSFLIKAIDCAAWWFSNTDVSLYRIAN
eukprot:CAMPEP_0169163078 /NCGR_PEP_ID=MMETSP1015-20121227/58058_1 /TAXON_ID=342587 /ORGANISM="Karlodinium micrum, Strain CCMP2283" /LENGTH=50 /DNA_ID=CAMNT_0009235321 /DNA_START=271 /DNA_END=423 /DNA_ORIENTATION=+